MKQSIPFRLYGGLIIAVLLVLMVGGVAMTALWRQTDEASWVEHTYRVKEQLRDTRFVLGQMRTGRRDYWVTGDDKYLTGYVKGQSLLLPAIEALKKEIADNPVQLENVNNMETAASNLLRFWQTDGVLQKTDDHDKVKTVIDKEESLLTALYGLFDKAKAEEDRLLVIRLKNKSDFNNQTKAILVGGIVILLMVVLLLINAILTTLKSRYKANLRLQETLGETEKLNAVAEEKNWQLQGVALVNDSMRGDTTTEKLSQDVLQAVVNYLQLPAGVMYVMNEDATKLEQCAAVGASAESVKTFTPGDGIVGRAAEQKEVLVIRDVPAHYWKVASALGEMSGHGEIVCVPLWMDGESKGVMELGRFSPFTEAQLNFLGTISNNISIGLNALQSREKIDNLLVKVQEHREALEHQQEELRQTNEELTRQTEILQSSEEELRVQEEELRQINAELEEKNEAVEVARQALMLKAEELQVTGKYKSEFLANMSHELRTPLNSILILAKLLSENKAGNLNDKQVEYSNVIHKSGSDLLKLINDILDLSKIEAGKIEFNFEEVPVKDIERDIQQLFSVVAEEKEVVFKTVVDATATPAIFTDKQRLEQVLKNLLSNAFKFTPKGGHITLSVAIAGDNQYFTKGSLVNAGDIVAFSVTDSGIGIARDKQQLIFEAFQQADGSTNRKYGGTGLGLSISKELVKQLGGEIQVTSAEGQGSTFTVYLPLKAGARAVQPGSIAPLPAQAEKTLAAVEAGQIVQQTRVPDDRHALQPHDKVMLIIEDDEQFARIIQDFSRGKNYKTIVALQGDEGLFYARKYRPTAIMLDMQLPVIDGWNLLKVLKADEVLRKIPVHIISAADESKLSSNGALAYLKKPVEKEYLEKAFDVIGSYLSSKVKKLLILSGDYIKDDNLRKLVDERHFDVECVYAANVAEALQAAEKTKFDCIIADIGKDIQQGLKDLERLQPKVEKDAIPVIIYLDKDISPTDEMKLKKVANVVIRESSYSKDRLLDEMELFLYKVQEADDQPAAKQNITLADNNILKGKKVLLVDDDMRNVFALSTALEEQQMDVITASDGKEALDILRGNEQINIVLMDIMMPEMDGYEATRRLRADLNLTKLPVIALTAKAMTGDREKTIEAGASDYITKPVDLNRLLSLMRVWLTQ
ncbi:response regulator [Deminuibacter soli]|uniref:histidine kinase n=1 Tax=Deminuibacter soli TaxID=2291815 RepID=A0A3E1NFE5_9BACT|nr:response regulator [Deminuibacter soli]RFM26524.1 response regulator [Deminuibacter soli]